MRIRDVRVDDVAAARNWRLKAVDDVPDDIIDWEIEDCSAFDLSDTVVYSALSVFEDGEVRPALVIREVGSYDWWGDMCEYVAGAWQALAPDPSTTTESCVGNPLPDDPSFMGEYAHDRQREQFARWRGALKMMPRGSVWAPLRWIRSLFH
jgi:hypothetical protein